MRKILVAVAYGLGLATLGSGAVAAPVAKEYNGSDTMLDLILKLQEDCRASSGPLACDGVASPDPDDYLSYIGGGSGAGQNALVLNTVANQDIAPMSRPLNNGACNPPAGQPQWRDTAKGWAIAADGLSLVARTDIGEICDDDNAGESTGADGTLPPAFGANLRDDGVINIQDFPADSQLTLRTQPRPIRIPIDTCPTLDAITLADNVSFGAVGDSSDPTECNASARTYTLSDIKVSGASGVVKAGTAWMDVLRILYTGETHSMGNNRIGGATTTGSPPANPSRAEVQDRIWQACNSELRRTLVNEWQNIIDDCTSGEAAGNACATDAYATATLYKGVRQLYRRGDVSGTTDTFLFDLLLPSIRNNPATVANPKWTPGSPFCNGSDQDDLDPIRVSCVGSGATGVQPYVAAQTAGTDDDVVCGRDGTLGLVLPIFVPEQLTDPVGGPTVTQLPPAAGSPASVDNARAFPRPTCLTGSFFLAAAPIDPETNLQMSVCPDGVPASGGNCWWPRTNTAASAAAPRGSFHCINKSRSNISPVAQAYWSSTGGGCTGANTPDASKGELCVRPDGRIFNEYVRDNCEIDAATNPTGANCNAMPAGSIPRNGRMTRYVRQFANGSPVAANRDITLAVYRQRQTTRTPTAAPDLCALQSSTRQIGCLATNRSCTLGYAGSEAADQDNIPGDGLNTVAMKVAGIGPSDASILSFVNGGTGYPLSRKLFINTLNQVNGGNPDQFGATSGFYNDNVAGNGFDDSVRFMAWLNSAEGVGKINDHAFELGFTPLLVDSAGNDDVAHGLQCVDFDPNDPITTILAGCDGIAGNTETNVNACCTNPADPSTCQFPSNGGTL